MDEAHSVHPANSLAQLAEHPAEERLVEARMALGIIDKVEQLTTADVLKNETMMRGRAKRVHVRDNRRMGDMLGRTGSAGRRRAQGVAVERQCLPVVFLPRARSSPSTVNCSRTMTGLSS